MEMKSMVSLKKSKLAAYASAMKKAQERNDREGAREWADGMVRIRREISLLMTQLAEEGNS